MSFRSKYRRLTATDNDEEEKTVMLPSSPTSPRSPEPWERYLAVFYATILLFVLINLSLFAATASKTGHLSFLVAPAVLDARTLPKPDQYVGLVGDHYGNATYTPAPYRRADGDLEVDAAGTVLSQQV